MHFSNPRWMVFFVTVLGLGTLFLPIFTVAPPAMGRAEWSGFDLLALMEAGTLSLERGLLEADMLVLWTTYAMLALGLLTVWLPRYHKPHSIFAFIGLMASGRLIQHGHYDLEMLFDSMPDWRQGAITYRPSIYALPAVMGVLLFLLWGEFRRN